MVPRGGLLKSNSFSDLASCGTGNISAESLGFLTRLSHRCRLELSNPKGWAAQLVSFGIESHSPDLETEKNIRVQPFTAETPWLEPAESQQERCKQVGRWMPQQHPERIVS